MPAFVRYLAIAILCCGILFSLRSRAGAQNASPEPVSTGTVAGRVTGDEDKPAAGIAVALLPVDFNPRSRIVGRATTDADGRYTLMNVAAGRYMVMPLAPAHIVESTARSWLPSKTVTLAAGETVDGIDFILERGGVITGRITDAEGKPIVAQPVQAVMVVDGSDTRNRGFAFDARLRLTDDRGIYRLYGLAPGRYRVSVGQDQDNIRFLGGGAGRPYYPRTFHPDTREEAQGKIIEVTAGGEATDIDITLGSRLKTFTVAGRITNAATNQPVAGMRVIYGALIRGSQNQVGSMTGGQMSDARGEFRIEGVVPGRYMLFADGNRENDMYSEETTFEVVDADVGNVAVKMHQGTSLSGVVVVEGGNERAARAILPRLSINAFPDSGERQTMFRNTSGRINPNGGFYIAGLRPGRVRLDLGGFPETKGFTLLRVERNGVALTTGVVDLSSGTPATDVRVVLAYGNGVVRGQVRIENGVLPTQSRMMVSARRLVGGEMSMGAVRPSEVDARGHFVIDGLAAGEYEITLDAVMMATGGRGGRPPSLRQRVMVGNSGETAVTFVLDLAPAETEGRP